MRGRRWRDSVGRAVVGSARRRRYGDAAAAAAIKRLMYERNVNNCFRSASPPPPRIWHALLAALSASTIRVRPLHVQPSGRLILPMAVFVGPSMIAPTAGLETQSEPESVIRLVNGAGHGAVAPV